METIKYIIHYQPKVIHKHIPDLPVQMQKSIKTAIEERLSFDPIGFGKPLQYSLIGLRRLRVGNYRIVYHVDRLATAVTIVAIKHRKDVYDF